MNQKIPTLIGTVIIIILAFAAGYFVWLTQKNNPVETQATIQPVDETANWQTYVSKLGYSFEYPKNWKCAAAIDEKGKQYGDNCLSDASQKILDEIDKSGKYDYFSNDLSIAILNMDIIEYMKSPIIQKIGDMALGGKSAQDIIEGGYGSNYDVVADRDGKVLELKFGVKEKKDMGENEKHILSTFKFTK
jgi:hypothetical protein